MYVLFRIELGINYICPRGATDSTLASEASDPSSILGGGIL